MDGIALASVISSGVVGVAAIGGGILGVRWSASLSRDNWLHERKSEAYLEIVEAVERVGERLSEEARHRIVPEIHDPHATEVQRESDAARISALERVYASNALQRALDGWRKGVTEVAMILSLPDADDAERDETRESLFGDLKNTDDMGSIGVERQLRDAVIEVIASELGQR